MNPFRFFFRELAFSKGLLFTFVLCTALSLISVVGLGAFDASVQESLTFDSKEVTGGDIIISSQAPLLDAMNKNIDKIVSDQNLNITEWVRFSSVVYHALKDESALAQIQAHDDIYPLYGSVILDKGDFKSVFRPGTALVEPNIMERLQLQTGDTLSIGEAEFIVSAVLKSLPTGSFSVFSSGQTIIIHREDLEKTQLIGARSRVNYTTALSGVSSENLDINTAFLENVSERRENIETYQSSETSTQRFLEEFLFFLNVISIFTLLLAGLGILTSLSAYIRKRQKSIAIFKTIGMTNQTLVRLFLGVILILALIGMILGTLGGIAMMTFLPQYFSVFLPEGFKASLQWAPLIQVVLLSFIMSLLFTITPLMKLRSIKPVEVFRKADIVEQTPLWLNAIITVLILMMFSVFVFLEVGNMMISLYLIAGIILLIGLTYLTSLGVLNCLRWVSNSNSFLLIRLSLKGLLRHGGKIELIMTAITTAFAVLMTISLLENNILYQFVNTYPEGFPNVFLLDIQKNQQDDLADLIDENVQFYPVVRGALKAIDGKDISLESDSEEGRYGDRLGRNFNLTYDVPLSDNERIISSQRPNQLFNIYDDQRQVEQVSLLEDFQDLLEVELGDTLVFSIQGVDITAEVSSIRKRLENRVEPFFYFIFKGSVLETAPQTLFATHHLPPEEIPQLQNSLAKSFPNIATIDTTEVILRTADLLQKLTMIIRFFGFFSLIAGLILLITALLSTSLERIREVVYYKLLGFRNREVAKIALMEFAFLGFFSAFLGTMGSQMAVYAICVYLLDLSFQTFFVETLIMNLSLISVVMFIATLFLFPLLKTKPVNYLRENIIE
ncbi:MAG: FtsX-like permease family protein [Candidatus Gracilibacteria bacterium]|nr:FtsX-like permease family protein [Candidatus Gracilibacteria bacterium]